MLLRIDPKFRSQSELQKEKYIITKMYKITTPRVKTAGNPNNALQQHPSKLQKVIPEPKSSLLSIAMERTGDNVGYKTLPEFNSPINRKGNIVLTPKDRGLSRLGVGDALFTPGRREYSSQKNSPKTDHFGLFSDSPLKLSPHANQTSSMNNIPVSSPQKKYFFPEYGSGICSPKDETRQMYGSYILDNHMKYTIRYEPLRSRQQLIKESAIRDLNQIKERYRIAKHKRIGLKSPSRKTMSLKNINEVNIAPKDNILSEEDELKVKLLKKKINISSLFSSPISTDEEKKALFKQLLLEYHPDKKKYDKRFSDEIFDFLMNNKASFLGNTFL